MGRSSSGPAGEISVPSSGRLTEPGPRICPPPWSPSHRSATSSYAPTSAPSRTSGPGSHGHTGSIFPRALFLTHTHAPPPQHRGPLSASGQQPLTSGDHPGTSDQAGPPQQAGTFSAQDLARPRAARVTRLRRGPILRLAAEARRWQELQTPCQQPPI